MQKEVTRSWALFIGIGTMMIAHGLQLQVMGIRSVIENFSVIVTGIFMSGYYIGYFVGSKTTPKLVSKVGLTSKKLSLKLKLILSNRKWIISLDTQTMKLQK